MSDSDNNKKKPFKCGYYAYETLDEALEVARKDAWRDGSDSYVWKQVAVARAPQLVKDIKTETLI